MGRSVNYLSHAGIVIYLNTGDMESYEYDDFRDNVCEIIESKYTSFNEVKKWEGNEVNIILENNFARVGISEYCGLTSISVAIRSDIHYTIPEQLAENWINSISVNFENIFITNFPTMCLKKIGTFSNGESIFELKKAS